MPVSPEALVALEQAEIEAFTDLYRAAGAEVTATAGLSVTPAHGAVILAANRIDVLALNRALGLGLKGSVSNATLDDVLALLAQCGSPRFFVPVAPASGHGDLARALAARGLVHYNNWVRLSKATADMPTGATTDLDVREIDRSSAVAFGRIVSTAFGYPPAVAPLAGQAVGRPGWRHYLAYDGEIPVASAAMYLAADTAWFGFAATDATYRKRGAQQALVVRRLRDAADAGCSRVSVETAEDGVLKDAPSFRNLRRLGFEIAYTRPNYIWTRPLR
jgi:hypothetical protein